MNRSLSALLQKIFWLLLHFYHRLNYPKMDMKEFVSVNELLVSGLGEHAISQPTHLESSKKRNAILLKSAFLETKYQHIRDSEGRFIRESSAWPDVEILLSKSPSLYFPKTFYIRLPSERPKISIGSQPYYHWLIEELPNFLNLKSQFPDCEVICFEDCPKYVRDFLLSSRITYALTPKFVAVRNLIFTPYSEIPGEPSLENLRTLRDYLLGIPRDNFSDMNDLMLYVSRTNSSRSPRFEKSFEDFLHRRGWTVVRSEKLSLFDQVQLFSRARVVLGLHGAGLANTIFMPLGSHVLEIRPIVRNMFRNDYISNCFENISKLLKNRHYQLEITESEYNEMEIPEKLTSIVESVEKGEIP